MSEERKVIIYISMSLDGYIADRNEELGFLSTVEKEGEDYGYFDFVNSVDAVIIGRKTYEKVLSMGYEYPHTDKEVYIITRRARPSTGSFQFYTGELSELVKQLKSKPGKNIYCDGGAEIIHALLKNKLADELIFSVIPILLGDGIKLFMEPRPEQKLELFSERSFEKGLVQLHYKILP